MWLQVALAAQLAPDTQASTREPRPGPPQHSPGILPLQINLY
jgi:hypothetical protein